MASFQEASPFSLEAFGWVAYNTCCAYFFCSETPKKPLIRFLNPIFVYFDFGSLISGFLILSLTRIFLNVAFKQF